MNSIQLKFYLMFVLSAECLLTLRDELLLSDLTGEPVFNVSLDSFALTLPISLAEGVKVIGCRIFMSTTGLNCYQEKSRCWGNKMHKKWVKEQKLTNKSKS